jgi:hypothetical protein
MYKQGGDSTYSLPQLGAGQQQHGGQPAADVQQRLDDLARRERELAVRNNSSLVSRFIPFLSNCGI